jgi:DNA-binding LacI/PurR family transcriptional regulator
MAQRSSDITIHDLADSLGLSTTTVWRALNDQSRISPKTRQRVMDEATRLNYRPSLVARALSSGKTQTLGLVLPVVANPTFAGLVQAVEDVAYERGYNVILCNTGFDLEKEKKQIELLMRRQVEGVVIVPYFKRSAEEDAHLSDLMRQGVPLVAMHHRMGDLSIPQVVPDNRQGAFDVATHLIKLGHKRLAYVHTGLSERLIPVYERYEGFKRALEEHGIAPRQVQVGPHDAHMPAPGMAANVQSDLVRDLVRGKEGATALFAPSDLLAARVMLHVKALGLSVPDDVAIAGFDDSPIASLSTPNLTSVCPPISQIGRRAAESLFEMLDNTGSKKSVKSALETSPQCLPCELIIRESTVRQSRSEGNTRP